MLQPPWDTMFASGFFRFAFPVPIFFINISAHHFIWPCHIHPHFYHNHQSAMQQWLHNDSICMKRKDYTGKIILIILISIINIINIIVAISGIIISRARREGEEVVGRRQPEWNVGSTRWSPFPLVHRPTQLICFSDIYLLTCWHVNIQIQKIWQGNLLHYQHHYQEKMDPVRGSGCGEHKLVHKQRMSLRIPLDFPSKVCAQFIVVMIDHHHPFPTS